MKKLLREPLVHFLLLGVGLFVLYDRFQPDPSPDAGPSVKHIRISIGELSSIAQRFRDQWKREPTTGELERLVAKRVDEEILYREALALGLDKDDLIVKRRMAQKMQFLAEDIVETQVPPRAELESWYEANGDKFALPTRVSFRHLYFSQDARGDRAREDAADALTKLSDEPLDSEIAAGLVDPFMFQSHYRDRDSGFLGKEFGPEFALEVTKLKRGTWQGPVKSGYGWHLVFVDSAVAGRVPAFEEVESEVMTAWLGEQKIQAWQKTMERMRSRYRIEAPLRGGVDIIPSTGTEDLSPLKEGSQ